MCSGLGLESKIRLSRDNSPWTIVKSRARSPKVVASSLITAALALPSTAGARTATTNRGGSPAVPPTLLREALGRTRNSRGFGRRVELTVTKTN